MMKSMNINFAPPSFVRFLHEINTLTWLGVIILVAISPITSNKLIEFYSQAKKNQIAIQNARKNLNEASRRKETKEHFSITDAKAESINTVIYQLNLPWNELFDALESATPSNIALLAVEPEAKKNMLKGTAEAKSSEDMIAYIRSLKQQKFFLDVTLLKHEILEQDINKPLRFQFLAQWGKIEP